MGSERQPTAQPQPYASAASGAQMQPLAGRAVAAMMQPWSGQPQQSLLASAGGHVEYTILQPTAARQVTVQHSHGATGGPVRIPTPTDGSGATPVQNGVPYTQPHSASQVPPNQLTGTLQPTSGQQAYHSAQPTAQQQSHHSISSSKRNSLDAILRGDTQNQQQSAAHGLPASGSWGAPGQAPARPWPGSQGGRPGSGHPAAAPAQDAQRTAQQGNIAFAGQAAPVWLPEGLSAALAELTPLLTSLRQQPPLYASSQLPNEASRAPNRRIPDDQPLPKT
jgi:hypothetical protein